MTVPATRDGAEFGPQGFTGRSVRTRDANRGSGFGALAATRFRRAMRRQAGTFFLVALPATAAAGLFFWSGGASTEMSALMGAGVAVGLALAVAGFRELSRNTITSLASLGNHRGYAILGAAPELNDRILRELPPDKRSPLGCLAFQPASPFATAFRDLQSRLPDQSVIAFIGSFPDEGATTAALCAGASATQQGRRVIVVDCDLRRRSLTRTFESAPERGVLEACQHPEAWRDYVEEEEETGVHFLPAARSTGNWSSLISAPGFRALLEELRAAYDVVILDCPPALGSAEGPVVARFSDKCVVVSAWDVTPLSAIRSTVRGLKGKTSTGVYVNRVPPGYRFGRLRPD